MGALNLYGRRPDVFSAPEATPPSVMCRCLSTLTARFHGFGEPPAGVHLLSDHGFDGGGHNLLPGGKSGSTFDPTVPGAGILGGGWVFGAGGLEWVVLE